jgi:hypothetical protein
MPADIVQGMNRAIVTTQDDYGILVELQREIVSWPGKFARMAGYKPACAPNGRDIEPIDALIRIKLSRQRPAGLTARDQRVNCALHGFPDGRLTKPLVFTRPA